MSKSMAFAVAMLMAAVFTSGCQKEESPVDKAVENTKDALDMREHEKLKDAGEDVQDAVNEAAQGVENAAEEAADDVNKTVDQN